MSNSKRSKRSKCSKVSKSRSRVGWKSIFWLILYAGLTWYAPSEAGFNLNLNFDFSNSQLNVNIAKAAPCCEKAVASPYV